jgi:hypothetical protein
VSSIKALRGEVINAAGKYLPNADVLSFFNNLVEAFREDRQTQREIADIDARRQVLIAEISRRYDFYQGVFDKVFAERKDAVDRQFDLVERDIQANNRELIVHGLQGISAIVSSSPFANVQELAKLMESGRQIEI